jgi:IS6 family transposase
MLIFPRKVRIGALLRSRVAGWGRLCRCVAAPLLFRCRDPVLAGFRFPPDVMGTVRSYPRYAMFYRDVEELPVERAVEVDHVTPLLIDAARGGRHVHRGGSSARPTSRSPAGGPPVSGDRSVPAGHRRADLAEAGPGCHSPVRHPRPRARPAADRDDHGSSAPCPRVPDQLLPGACHVTDRYANKPVDADHGQLKARLRTVRGPERLRSARTALDMRSRRTSAAATTNTESTSIRTTGSQLPSPDVPSPSGQSAARRSGRPTSRRRNSAGRRTDFLSDRTGLSAGRSKWAS